MKFIENEITEFKEIYTNDIKKEVVAFLNTNGGYIYIGIDDSGNIKGIDDVDDTILKLTNSLRDSIRPDAMMFVQTEILNVEDKYIIKITISEGTRKPYYLIEKGIKSSGVYVRQGSSKAQASEDSIKNMIKISDGDSFENNRSLDQNLTFDAFSKEMQARNLEFAEVQKKNLGILSNDDMFTNLALITSDQCKHTIKLAFFQGSDKSIFRDRKEFTGSVFLQLSEAYKGIDFYNRTRATFDELYRIDRRDYPEDAIREALLNAIIHRDYSFSGSISINIYSDKIEIISLGGLVSGLSIEAVMLGASQSRNEKLAAIFYRMKLIESYGIGISKIMSSYKDSVRKPTFENATGAFKVTLPNLNAVTITYTETQSKVIRYIEENESITRAEIEGLLNVKLTRANNIIKEMLELNIIKKIGEGKNTKYILRV